MRQNNQPKSAGRKAVDQAKRGRKYAKRAKRLYKAVKRTIKLMIKTARAVVRSARRVFYVVSSIGAPAWIFLSAVIMVVLLLVIIINIGGKAAELKNVDAELVREIVAKSEDSGIKEDIDQQVGDSIIVALDCSNRPPDQRQPGVNCIEGLIDSFENGQQASPVPERASFMVPVWKAAARRYQVPWMLLAAIEGARSNFALRNCDGGKTGSGAYQLRESAWETYAFDGGSVALERSGTNCYRVIPPKEASEQKSTDQKAPETDSQEQEVRFIKSKPLANLKEDIATGPYSTADIYDPVDSAFTQARILARNKGFKTKDWDKYSGSGPGQCSTQEEIDGQVWYYQPDVGGLGAGGPGAKFGYNKKLKIPTRALQVAAKYRSNRGKWKPRASLSVPSMPKKDIVYLLRTAWAAFGARGAELNRNVTMNYAQIGLESGGSPQLIQVCGGYVDINCAQGNPARGMFQFIPSTFKSWKVDGFNDIYNPLDNILAAVNAQVNSNMAILDGGSGWGPGSGSNPYTTGGKSRNVAPAADSNGPAKSLPYRGKPQTDRLSEAVAYRNPGNDYSDCYVAVVNQWYKAIKKNPPVDSVTVSGPLRNRIIKIAQAELKKGVVEQGYNNPHYRNGKIAPYNIGSQPWCQAFASWVWYQAGFKKIAKVPGMSQASGLTLPAYTGAVSAAASAKQYGMTFKTKNPLPGDFLMYGDNHVEIVEKVKNGKVLSTIGGNTSDAVARVTAPGGYTHFISPPASAGKSSYQFSGGKKKSKGNPEKAFLKLANDYNLRAGLAVSRNGYTKLYGQQQLVKSWSTIFLPLAVTLVRERGGYNNLSSTQRRAIRRALRNSDGQAASSIFWSIANKERLVYRKINNLFRGLNDITAVNRRGSGAIDSISSTTWSLRGANRMFAALVQGKLVNKSSTNALIKHLQNVTPSQQWGFGAMGPDYQAIKGGWAPDPQFSGRYLMRQTAIVNNKTVVSLAITPRVERSKASLTSNMTRLANWVKKNLSRIPKGTKDSKLIKIQQKRVGGNYAAKGIITGRGLTVKGAPANKRQRRVAYEIIAASLKYDPPRKALYAILQGATVESVMGTRGMNRAVDYDSIGILQGRQMYHKKKNLQSIPYNVRIFMKKSYTSHPSGGAISMVRKHPSWSSGIVAANNLGPAAEYRHRYDLYRKEAEKWLKAFYRQQ